MPSQSKRAELTERWMVSRRTTAVVPAEGPSRELRAWAEQNDGVEVVPAADAVLTLQDAKALYGALSDVMKALKPMKVDGRIADEEKLDRAWEEAIVVLEALAGPYAA